jgi:hypothetical protein
LVVLVVIILCSGFSVFLNGHWNADTFVVSYVGIPIFFGKLCTLFSDFVIVILMRTPLISSLGGCIHIHSYTNSVPGEDGSLRD